MASNDERGFSIIEVVVSVSLLAVGVSAVAQLAVLSARAGTSAQAADTAQYAAREKLEQLRALTFVSDDGAVTVTDVSSDLSVTPSAAAGGPGLAGGSGDTLLSNVAGFCDFLDGDGRWLSGGTRPPAGAVWVRRWSMQPLPGLADTILLQVVVLPARLVGDPRAVAVARSNNGAWLFDLRARTAR